ncbi:MAG: pilus assembly protein Flp/PilA [Afipia broomeae]|jgi:pilus assembly protein Flp/PilA|nr:MAG: Flp family type IVb pilin [Bradyrhizobiaceae bacterium]HAO42532.1 Flp family type IVb pilin [Afipia sp.]HAP14008.1 Flp family type IVb pilin [Afipia sp.]HAP49182.1 Flp family type IVb pilin [Afipia sp.]HAQ93121.1 Flp family type IVb pilin [Afipia sp.]|tara:strand:+ start:213 stop:404 length:192 start_codon:yes stop_codon:yes gene_type:complete
MCKKCSEADPMKKAIDFIRDERAATSIEYALIATGIAVAIVAAVNGLGTTLGGKYATVKAAFD